MKKNIHIIFVLLLTTLFVNSCSFFRNKLGTQELIIIGSENKKSLLYKINFNQKKQETKITYKFLNSNESVFLPHGEYLIVNECSAYRFKLDGRDSYKIYLNHINLSYLGSVLNEKTIEYEEHILPTKCFNMQDGSYSFLTDKDEFDLFPGPNSLEISGKKFNFNFKNEKAEYFSVDLSPLTIISENSKDNTQFFVRFLGNDNLLEKSDSTLSAPLNSVLWLNPGKYEIEVNGTKEKVEIKSKLLKKIKLGTLRIEKPPHFPMKERLESGAGPIFSYIDKKILLKLDTDYSVFPGYYTISFENSNVEKRVEVEEQNKTIVKTFGAQVDPPDCEQATVKNCPISQRITLHVSKQPFVILLVPLGIPFLVFNDSYQYGIEGVSGLLKNLITSPDSVYKDQLGRIKINWEIKPVEQNLQTDFVRFESSSAANVLGKSLDLSFGKPKEIFLPQGDYRLTYLIRDLLTSAAPKIVKNFKVSSGKTSYVMVPIYSKTDKNQTSLELEMRDDGVEDDTLRPIFN